MSLIPYRSLDRCFPLSRRLNENFFSDPFELLLNERTKESWSPAVNITEEEGKYVVTADIPGVDPKDIEVTMEKGTLTIRGERSHEETQEHKEYKVYERSTGTFSRSFTFPDNVDVDSINAKGRDGVLTIEVPKAEDTKAKRIPIS